MPYKLAATLAAHSSDVRAVASPTDTLVLSASRDTTAVSWTRPTPAAPFAQDTVFRAGSKYINSITYIPASTGAPHGYVVTGGQDSVINVFTLGSGRGEPSYSLLGHTENICALDATPGGLVISGSWDRTARVWKDFQFAYELKGHGQSVWAVLVAGEETYLTGSADKSIKLWKQHKAVRSFDGHKDAVRGLALLPDLGFASCSNDSEIRVWTMEGDIIYTLSGHTSFVYSLSVLANGDIVSGGEDRTVRIWRDGECAQIIVHPAISVWSVSSMPNGDIVSGCSDGVVRVFSSSEERWVSAEDMKAFEDKVASQALPSQEVGDVKKSDLPGLEALSIPGKKPGDVKMIRNGDIVEAHQWDSSTTSWQKIGDVVDAVGSGRKQLYDGKEYDYVFDVDIQDGVPPLKLPYNANENPHGAAQRFLNNNDLPLTYVDEVVKFIEKNTEGVNLSSSSDFVDPYTGASRYQTSPSSVPTATTSNLSADPFTGGSRYTPTGAPAPPPQAPLTQRKAVLPIRTFLSFKQANVPAMHGKLYQLDDAFRHEISTTSLALYPEDIKSLDDSLTFLTQATASPSSPPTPALTFEHIDTVIQVLERWPSSQRFPVIDLARLISGYCPTAYAGPGQAKQFFHALLTAAEWSDSWQSPIPKPRETNVLLTLRALANALQENSPVGGGEWVSEIFEEVAKAPYEALNKSQRVTLATLLFNFSCVRLNGPVESSAGTIHLSLLTRTLTKESTDAETVYRATVALGNTLYALKAQGTSILPVESEEFRRLAKMAATKFPEERVKAVVDDINALL